MKCSKYGVLCNFSFNVPDLKPVSESTKVQLWRKRLPPLAPVSNAVWSSDGYNRYILDAQDCLLLYQFRQHTVFSLGGDHMVDAYESSLLQKCFTNPFMMHGTLAVAALHFRYMTGTNEPSFRESFHVSLCTSLFNRWLSQPLTEERKDPIWSGAGSLSIITFASTMATCPNQAWPLRSVDPLSDLGWLRLGTGKMSLWNMVNPTREGSVFQPMFKTLGELKREFIARPVYLLPELTQVCGIDTSSTPDNNPYFAMAHSMSALLHLPDDKATLGMLLAVAGSMHGSFQNLLHQRDPVALLLLCLWYAKARKCKWWIDFRARYEIPAICRYLHANHADKESVIHLLGRFGVMEIPL